MKLLFGSMNPTEIRISYCNECGRMPHAMGCPNAPEPTAVFVCSGCGRKIYEGEDYYDILGEQFCEECINETRQEAVYDPY